MSLNTVRTNVVVLYDETYDMYYFRDASSSGWAIKKSNWDDFTDVLLEAVSEVVSEQSVNDNTYLRFYCNIDIMSKEYTDIDVTHSNTEYTFNDPPSNDYGRNRKDYGCVSEKDAKKIYSS